jgi:hypothetical protein
MPTRMNNTCYTVSYNNYSYMFLSESIDKQVIRRWLHSATASSL